MITTTMNQESIKKIDQLESDPIDIMPPTDVDMLDYIIMNRQRVILMVAIPTICFILGWKIIGSVIGTLCVLSFLGAFRNHKKDEKKINGLIHDYWKLRLEEFSWLGQFQ